jgi:hypothetical protein
MLQNFSFWEINKTTIYIIFNMPKCIRIKSIGKCKHYLFFPLIWLDALPPLSIKLYSTLIGIMEKFNHLVSIWYLQLWYREFRMCFLPFLYDFLVWMQEVQQYPYKPLPLPMNHINQPFDPMLHFLYFWLNHLTNQALNLMLIFFQQLLVPQK